MSLTPPKRPAPELEAALTSVGLGHPPPLGHAPEGLASLPAGQRGLGVSPHEVVLAARHPARPQALDVIAAAVDDFVELRGDRRGVDDPALVGGVGRWRGVPVVVLGQQKGHDLAEAVHRRYGMPAPEGYRKAIRLMRHAERFGLPLVTLIDTPGAFPGASAEATNQAGAIAEATMVMSQLKVPCVAVVLSEGGSGGALAIAVADQVLMCERAYYSVISPEGCATILWRDASRSGEAAAALKITATDLLALGVVDRVIPEPVGGAHTDPGAAARAIAGAVAEVLASLEGQGGPELVASRTARFRAMGRMIEADLGPT